MKRTWHQTGGGAAKLKAQSATLHLEVTAMPLVAPFIPVGNVKYTTSQGLDYENMTTLSTSTTPLETFDLGYKTNDSASEIDQNLYWRVQIPEGTLGLCEGTIQLTALQSS